MQQVSTKIKVLVIVAVLIVVSAVGISWLLLSNQSTGQLSMDEELSADVTVISEGNLVRIDNSHWGTSVVQIVQNEAGNYFVYFVDVDRQWPTVVSLSLR